MRLEIGLLLLFFTLMLRSVHSKHWTRHSVLDTGGAFHLYWNPPGNERDDSLISFKVEMRARGYFGLGFSPNGGMPGSDIVTGWIKDGEVFFQDRHAIEFSLPIKDYQQDYELIDAYENDTFTVFEFRRKLATCDETDTVINENTMRVIYAYSEEDPESEDPFYHGEKRGAKSVLLLQGKNTEDQNLKLTSILHWDVMSPNVDISSFKSVYWCKIFKSPQLSEKHHIVSVKPVIQEGHEQFVHHMLLYECVGGTQEEFEIFVEDTGYECYQPNMPDLMQSCGGTITTWVFGGEGITFPDHVGLPLKAGLGNYYMLEIHYDNPHLRTGIIDHSGLRYFYTPILREFDVGDFQIGASFLPRVFIPPGQEKYSVVSHSSDACFGSTFPDGRIKVLASLPHGHLIARAIKVRHFRGNKELTPLVDDQNYDFNYQQYRYYREEVDILAGDQITVECIYDSSQRSNATFGGFSTREEMCLVHFLYYPLVNQYYSTHSGPTYTNINKVLGTNITRESDLYRALESYDWTKIDIKKVENIMRYSEHESQCYWGEFQGDEVHPLVSYPKDLIPYSPETMCNVAASNILYYFGTQIMIYFITSFVLIINSR